VRFAHKDNSEELAHVSQNSFENIKMREAHFG